MLGLAREVIKWLQSLDLMFQIKNPKWDLSNGYLIAEIFSWYFPQDIQMFSFYNGGSLELKKRNWYILKNFILKNQIGVTMEDVDGTIFCKEGAAIKLMESLYECLTNRSVKKVPSEKEFDYMDYAYQMCLPMHQRSTASKALKNNLRLPEILADLNITKGSIIPSWYSDRTVIKSQKIINDHIEHRREERRSNPSRFDIKPTLGDRCVRRSITQPKKVSLTLSHLNGTADNLSEQQSTEDKFTEQPLTREPSVHFKEVEVKQTNRNGLYQLPIQSY
uniref:CH-like domain-containing protein n=1 Tax=Arion vulgaris TaxID=1028688 RepID=A0A0B7AAM7_9EUPU